MVCVCVHVCVCVCVCVMLLTLFSDLCKDINRYTTFRLWEPLTLRCQQNEIRLLSLVLNVYLSVLEIHADWCIFECLIWIFNHVITAITVFMSSAGEVSCWYLFLCSNLLATFTCSVPFLSARWAKVSVHLWPPPRHNAWVSLGGGQERDLCLHANTQTGGDFLSMSEHADVMTWITGSAQEVNRTPHVLTAWNNRGIKTRLTLKLLSPNRKGSEVCSPTSTSYRMI